MTKRAFFAPIKKKTSKKRISLRIPKGMLDEILEAMQKTGYPPRDRSNWISNAIENLAKNPDYVNCIKEEWIESGNNIPIQVSLTKDAEQVLANIVEDIQQNNINKSDIQSSIVRTSIIHEILNSE